MPAGTVTAGSCLRRIDVGAVADTELRSVLAAAADAAAAALSPSSGMMVQAVWLDAGAARPGRLLLVIHHLVVDGVSWRILVPDLAAAWHASSSGGLPALPSRGTSFRGWAERLLSQARDERVVAELPVWRQMLERPSLSLVNGSLDADRDTAGTAGHLTLRLPAAVTEALLTRVPARFHGGIQEVLLSGLAVAVADWCRRHNGGEGGRDGLAAAARVFCWMSKVTAARRCSGRSICRGRWAGSPAFTRCGWMCRGLTLRMRSRAGQRLASC